MKQRRSPGPAFRQSSGARLQNASQGSTARRLVSTLIASDGRRTFYAGRYDPSTATFRKRLEPEHILRHPPAIALQVCVVEELQRRGCRQIEARMPDGDVLTVPFALFTLKAEVLDRGFGAQLALPLRYWTSRRKTELQPALTGLEV